MVLVIERKPSKTEKKRIAPTWAVDNPDYFRPPKKVRVHLSAKTYPQELEIDIVEREIKEESPDLMPENDDMLAAFAAAVDDTCMTIDWGSEMTDHKGKMGDESMDIEEDTDEILSSLDDEPFPTLEIRQPDVARPFADSVTLAEKPLTLDKKAVVGYLRHFQFKPESLESIPALQPYLTLFNRKLDQRRKIKKAAISTSSDLDTEVIQSNRNSVDNAPQSALPLTNTSSPEEWHRKANDNFFRGIMAYPLSEDQLKVVRLFAAQTTIVCTDLLDVEQVLKLIALSLQVTIPYFGHCLFPNLRNVVFASSFRIASVEARYANPRTFDPSTSTARPDALPHPISMLLYWIAESYDVCIHYPSANEKHTTIVRWTKLMRKVNCEEETACIAAEKSWIALDTLDCMLGSLSVNGIRSLSLHSVQVGATFDLDIGPGTGTGFDTVIRFAPRSISYSVGRRETIDSMVRIIMHCIKTNPGSVTWHNIEHLTMPRQFGPINRNQEQNTTRPIREAVRALQRIEFQSNRCEGEVW